MPKNNVFQINLTRLKKPLHDKFSQYTEQEIGYIKMRKCKQCIYAMSFDSGVVPEYRKNPNAICCGYLMLTNKRRPKRPELCDLYLSDGDDIMDQGNNNITMRTKRRRKVLARGKNKKYSEKPVKECLEWEDEK